MTTHWFRRCACLGLLFLAAVAVSAQRRDPFTQPEIDKIRDSSWDPQIRLSLYVKFARARLAALDKVRNDPKAKDRPQQIHDKLDDFLLIYDELNDNIDTYIDRKNDIRHPLKQVIEADVEFKGQLRTLKEGAGVPPEEMQRYEFILSSALDAVTTSLQDHRRLLAEQEEAAKHGKKFEAKPSGGSPE